MNNRTLHLIFLPVIALCIYFGVQLFPSINLILPFFLGFFLLTTYMFLVIQNNKEKHEALTPEEQISVSRKNYKTEKIFLYLSPFTLFLIFGAYESASFIPLFFIPLLYLLARFISKNINQSYDDEAQEILFKPIFQEIKAQGKNLYEEAVLPLTTEDIQLLKKEVKSGGYGWKQKTLKRVLKANKKIVVKGYLTEKGLKGFSDGPSEFYWKFNDERWFEVHQRLIKKVTVGDLISLELVEPIYGLISKNLVNIVLHFEVIDPSPIKKEDLQN